MQMPPLDPDILARRGEIVAALKAIVPGEGVIDEIDGMRPFECDALSAYRQMPLVVVLPETVDQVAAILRYCQDHKVKVVPRCAGTSLSGGSMPVGDAILLGLSKFNRIHEIGYAIHRTYFDVHLQTPPSSPPAKEESATRAEPSANGQWQRQVSS